MNWAVFWPAVAAITAVVCGVSGLNYLLIGLIVDKALAKNNLELMRQMNGTYVRADLCDARRKVLNQQIQQLEPAKPHRKYQEL